jgi:hypothetical protein
MESTIEEKIYPYSSTHVKEDVDVNHQNSPLPVPCSVKVERKERWMDVTTVKQEPIHETDDVKCKKSGWFA